MNIILHSKSRDAASSGVEWLIITLHTKAPDLGWQWCMGGGQGPVGSWQRLIGGGWEWAALGSYEGNREGKFSVPPLLCPAPAPSSQSAAGSTAQVSGERVMLDGLVQHECQQPCPVRHGCPHIALLLKQLVQLVPL